MSALVRKAVNQFTFLGRTHELLVKPICTVSGLLEAVWFSSLPIHSAVRSRHATANADPHEPLLEVDRVPRLDPPKLPDALTEWVASPLDDIDEQPSLREAIFADEPERWRSEPSEVDEQAEDERDPRRVLLTEAVGVSEAFERVGWSRGGHGQTANATT
jgi:hypothetical protein